MAKSDERIDNVVADVRVLAPLVVQMAEQRMMLNNVRDDVHGCTDRLDNLRRELQQERERLEAARAAEGKESRRNRWALLSGVLFVVLATVGNLVVQILIVQGTP
jgi:hypothetical protein